MTKQIYSAIFFFYSILSFAQETPIDKKNGSDPQDQSYVHEDMSGYRPIDPITYNLALGFYDDPDYYVIPDTNMVYWEDIYSWNRLDKSVYFSDLSNASILKLLANEQVGVYIQEKSKSAEINYLTAAASHKGSEYTIIMDYGKSVTIPIAEYIEFKNTNGMIEYRPDIKAYFKVGVGLRIIAKIKAHKNGVNVGDLFAIGLAGENEKITGTISTSVIGISGKEVTTLLPMPVEINKNTIQSSIIAIATVKSKIHDDNIALIPQILSVRAVNSSDNEDLVMNPVRFMSTNYKSNILATNHAIYSVAPQLFTADSTLLK